MKFEFNTEVDGAKEAAALASALAVLHGSAVADALGDAADRIEGAVTLAPFEVKAADGYPVSAADVFASGPEVAVLPISGRALDSARLPWDERIHAGTKATNKDGTWSRRRNTPDDTYDAVMAELKGAPPAPTTVVPPPPPPAETPLDDNPDTGAPLIGMPALPLGAAVTFPQLMVKITKAQTAGTIDKATVDGFLGTFGLDKIAGLASAGADTIAAVNAMVDEHING